MYQLPHQREPEEEKEEGAPIWMITFADMTTLLMAFFVLLLSFANTDIQKFKKMMGSVRDTFGTVEKKAGGPGTSGTDNFDAMLREAAVRAGVEEKGGGALLPPVIPGKGGESTLGTEEAGLIVRAMYENFREEGVEVTQTTGGVTVRVPGSAMFEPGSAELRKEAEPLVAIAQKLLFRYRMDLHIIGHTDSVPIQTARYPSNWELSAARASAALRYMAEKGVDPKRLVAVGYADSRPLADNGTFEGRQKNRRIEFVFKNPETAPETGRQKPAGE